MDQLEERSLNRETTNDPADVFVRIYDRMSVQLFRSKQLESWFRETGFRNLAESVTEACLTYGSLDPAWISENTANGPKEELATLVGIDDALVYASPWSASPTPAGMMAVRDRYLTTGRFNRATSGGLLPRRSFHGRPHSGKDKHHYFQVVRVSPQIWGETYRNEVLPSEHDPWHSPMGPIPVAFVPMLASYDDLDIRIYSLGRPDELWYQVGPRSVVADRLPAVLEALDRSGAQLAVLPEGGLSDEILESWQQLLRRQRPGWRSALRWILLGSGPVGGKGNNRAVLVDRWGRELLRQDKLSDFTMTDWQVLKWRLPDPDGLAMEPGTTIREDIPRDVVFTTIDSFLGRLGVLICESLSRWPDDRHSEIIDSAPSHIMVPVFSRPIRREGWEDDAGSQLSNLVGSWVMVANSHATEARANAESNGSNGSEYSYLVCGPVSEERNQHRLTKMFGLSTGHLSAADVAYQDPEETEKRSLPFVKTAFLSPVWYPERED